MPFTIKVITEDSKLVKQLQQRLRVAEDKVGELQKKYNDIEFRLICEMELNMQLTDLLRENGIKFRQSLDRRKRR